MGKPDDARIERPAHIGQEDWDAAEVPELTAEDFARAKPFPLVFPGAYAAWAAEQALPTAAKEPKVHLGLRVAADVAREIKASGPGSSARVETVLRRALAEAKI